jgi:hypothetical protein
MAMILKKGQLRLRPWTGNLPDWTLARQCFASHTHIHMGTWRNLDMMA